MPPPTLEAPVFQVHPAPAIQEPATTRFYYLDSMRSVLMLLGVVLHGGLIYSSGDRWIISDSHQSEFFCFLCSAIHAFRLPTFFIVAGFFSMMSLEKYGTGTFTKTRLLRILPPLFFTALLINSLELYVRTIIIQQQSMSIFHFMIHELPRNWIDGQWVSHLWFLLTLLQLFAIGIALYLVSGNFVKLSKLNRLAAFFRNKCYFLLLLPLSQIAWCVAAKVSPGVFQGIHFYGLINFEELLAYLPYFLVGLWLYRDHQLQQEFHSFARWEWYALILSLIAQYAFSDAHGANPLSLLRIYSTSLTWGLTSHLCYVLFFKLMNRNSCVFRYLSDASYSIYLFHHLFVVLFGFLLLESEIAIGYKFLAVETATLSITLAIHHHLILKSRTLRFMFNGKLN